MQIYDLRNSFVSYKLDVCYRKLHFCAFRNKSDHGGHQKTLRQSRKLWGKYQKCSFPHFKKSLIKKLPPTGHLVTCNKLQSEQIFSLSFAVVYRSLICLTNFIRKVLTLSTSINHFHRCPPQNSTNFNLFKARKSKIRNLILFSFLQQRTQTRVSEWMSDESSMISLVLTTFTITLFSDDDSQCICTQMLSLAQFWDLVCDECHHLHLVGFFFLACIRK